MHTLRFNRPFCRWHPIPALLCLATALAPALSRAQTVSSPPPTTIAAALQPFVDRHSLAGAVTMVATTNKVLAAEAVGFADVAAKQPMKTDAVKFCQMILNGGVFQGKRLLSEAAVQQMTTRQTGPDLKESYGLGFAIGADWCGHGGAHATNMIIDRQRGLVLVWMVQHSGFPGKGNQSQEAFKQAAHRLFAPRP